MAIQDQVGTFAWFSLMTRDTNKANQFYGDLLGWKIAEMDIPGMGKSVVYNAGGENFGNPVDMSGDAPADMPPHWIPYIAVLDVDQCIPQAEKLGGKLVVPAFDIPSVGRTAVIQDPAGAAMHIYTPENKEDDLKMTGEKPGMICWVELTLEEPEKVMPFYSELFGWKISEPMSMGSGAYYSVEINGQKLGGFMKRDIPMPPMWMSYMSVENVEEATQKAQGLGGKMLMGKTEIPQTGFFSMIQDPTGAMFFLYEHSM